jgi:hypothetical protein
VREDLDLFQAEPARLAAEPGAVAEPAHETLRRLIEAMSRYVLRLSLIQVQARLDTVTLIPIELTSEEALETARENRRDWMDARAALVDTWRQIELKANDLKSGLDVTFSGDMGTTGNNPAQFRSTTGSLRVGLEFDAPLTRLAERNAYRQALINYQRARRDYYLFEDRVSQSLRNRLRTIRLNELDFEVQRAAVRMAITRVDETQRRLDEPPKQGGTLQIGESFVERFLSDFSALLSAQNRLLSVWVDHEVQRMNLDLDLGTMQLDGSGMWIDPGSIEASREDPGNWGGLPLVFPDEFEELPVPDGNLEAPGGARLVPQ